MTHADNPVHPAFPESEDRLDKQQTLPGACAPSPWRMPLAAWRQIIKRVWVMIGFHQLGLLSAGVAFFIFLAITPLIAATVMIYGLVGNVESVRDQMSSIIDVVPREVAMLIEEQLLQAVTTSSGVAGFALAIALFFAIYGGMRAASGMISALNVINQERETRNIAVIYSRALGLTVAALLIALTGILTGSVFAWLALQTKIILGPWTDFLIKLLTWAAAILLGSTGFALIMRYGPDRRPAKWRWLTPGSLVATVLWIAISFGFSLYVAYISDYNATYGSLSAIVVFLMWLYLSAYGILLGALVNAEVERQSAIDTTAGPDRPAGHRGAVLADLTDAPSPSLEVHEVRRARRADRARYRADRSLPAEE